MRHFIIIILTTFVSLNAAFAAIEKLDSVIAIVNDDVITQKQLTDAMSDMQLQLHRSHIALPNEDTLKKRALEQLILDEVQLQHAKATGIQIDDFALDEMISRIAKNNNLSLTEFREALAQEGMSFNDYRQKIRRQTIINQVQQRDVANRIDITNQEIERFLNSPMGRSIQDLEYRLGHILLSIPEDPSPEALKAKQKQADSLKERLDAGEDFTQLAIEFSDSQQANAGGDLGWRRLAEIPTLFSSAIPVMNINDVHGPIRSASGFHIIKLLEQRNRDNQESLIQQTHVRHILVKPNAMLSTDSAKLKLQNIKAQLENGEDFTTLAKAYSEDIASKSKGGDLGWVTDNVLVAEFSRVMNKTNPNEISEPFESPFGWHILQVLERREENNTELHLKQKAKNVIRNRKLEERLETWVKQLRDESYVHVYSQENISNSNDKAG